MRWGAGRSCPGRYWMLCLLLLALATPASRAGQRGLLLRWGLGHRAVEAIGRFACFCLLWLFLLRGHGKLVCSCAGVLGSIFGRDLTFCFSLLAVSGAASDCWLICLLLRWGSEFAGVGRYWLPCVLSSSHRSFHHCRHYHFHYHRLSHHRRHHHSDHIHHSGLLLSFSCLGIGGGLACGAFGSFACVLACACASRKFGCPWLGVLGGLACGAFGSTACVLALGCDLQIRFLLAWRFSGLWLSGL